jgi:hypothetical protein
MKLNSALKLTGIALAFALPAYAAPNTTTPTAMSIFKGAAASFAGTKSMKQLWYMTTSLGQMGSVKMYMHFERSGTLLRYDMSMKMLFGNIPGMSPADKKKLNVVTNIETYADSQTMTVYSARTGTYTVQPLTTEYAAQMASMVNMYKPFLAEIGKSASEPGAFAVKPGMLQGQNVWWVTINPKLFADLSQKQMDAAMKLMNQKPANGAATPVPSTPDSPVSPMQMNPMAAVKGVMKNAKISMAFSKDTNMFMGMVMKMQIPGLKAPVTARMDVLASKTNIDIPASDFTFIPPKGAKKVDSMMDLNAGMVH